MENQEVTINLFFVCDSPISEETIEFGTNKVYSITATQEEAMEYVNSRIFLQNQTEYLSWCTTTNSEPNNTESWSSFLKDNDEIIDQFSKFYIQAVAYPVDELLAITRIFYGCHPIGCSYDYDIEYTYSKDTNMLIEDNWGIESSNVC